MQHLRAAASLLATVPQHPFEIAIIRHAQSEFASARSAFSVVSTNLQALPGISTSLPTYGSRLHTALYLAAAATNIAQAGSLGCTLLEFLLPKLHNPLLTTGQSLSREDVTHTSLAFQQIKATLSQAINEASQVQPSDLQFDAHMSSMFASFYKELPLLHMWLVAVEKLFPALPLLLGIGTPAHYLLEVLDTSELRPSGGFIGNYGIVTFANGSLADAQIRDVVLLDAHFENSGHYIFYPPAYMWFSDALGLKTWRFRDSNLDADFPTAARDGEQMYTKEGGNVAVQGVVAITPVLIQRILEMTGPIAIPEYHETVSAQNLVALIHYHQLDAAGAGQGSSLVPSPDGYSSTRKHFIALLAEHLFARIHTISPAALPKFLQLLLNSLQTKDIQLYFNASSAENVLQNTHLDGAIQATAGDSLLIVDANVSPNKANSFIRTAIQDKVTLDAYGNATHATTISYAWTIAGRNYGNALYRDYMRIYTPPNGMLQSQAGWQSRGTGTAFGRAVWNGFFTLTYGQTRAITFMWTVPHAATKVGASWHYQYLVQRQAGIQRELNLQIITPSCAVLSNTGREDVGKISSFTRALSEDMNFEKDYTCQ